MRGGGVIRVLELQHLAETLAVLPQDILASWLGKQRRGEELDKDMIENISGKLITNLQFHHNVGQPYWDLSSQEEE